jgi:hypothetical protein
MKDYFRYPRKLLSLPLQPLTGTGIHLFRPLAGNAEWIPARPGHFSEKEVP